MEKNKNIFTQPGAAGKKPPQPGAAGNKKNNLNPQRGAALNFKPYLTSRGDVLDAARNLICGDRAKTHGDASENFGNIADLWSVYLSRTITARDVALMMALLKIARTKSGTANSDDIVDAIGYLALGEEVVSAPSQLGAE